MVKGASAHEHLQEIDSPQTRYKLEGYQEVSYSLDEEILRLNKAVDEKRGVVQAADVIAQRLLQECNPIAEAARDEKMEPDEAKIRISVVKQMSDIVKNIGVKNRADLITFQGMIQGIERSRKLIEGRFNDEVGKYERWKRIEAEDAEEATAAPVITEDRPVAEVASKPETEPGEKGKVVPLHKKAPAKAKAKAPPPEVEKAPEETVESEVAAPSAEDKKAKLKQVLGKRKKKAKVKAKAPTKE